MATATETVADVIHLRKFGGLAFDEGYVSQNYTGITVTNPIYQIPSDKYAEIIVHIWDDGNGNANLGRLCVGRIDSNTSNNRLQWLRYRLGVVHSNGITDEGISATMNPNQLYQQSGVGAYTVYHKDMKIYAAPSDYIFRDSNSAGSTTLAWDMTIILRNQP